MKKSSAIFLLSSLGIAASAVMASASDLVILTTNDTHSNIDSYADGSAGILPRKAVIDSVRRAEPNTLLIDAGDMVQGSLYFKYFHGDVEYPLANMMGYDVRILGNHEFDNGLKELASYWKDVKAARLSANYDFRGTPAQGLFSPYVIKKIDGKKIGIMGINVDPESLIVADNYKGMKFLPVIETANKTAALLRKKGCKLVIAVTHIGYENANGAVNDLDLARESRDIDIIIGGHSHTLVNPDTPDKTPYWVDNAAGRPVLVTQTGKYGRYVGKITIDLDEWSPSKAMEEVEYSLIPVTDHFHPASYDKAVIDFLAPFKAVVDSVNTVAIGTAAISMSNSQRNGAMANWTADMAMYEAAELSRQRGDSVPLPDFSIMNVGGIRHKMDLGDITEGQILSTYPFSNRLQMIRIKGADVAEALGIAAKKGGESVSSNLRVVTDADRNLLRVVLDGREIDPDRYYNVATLDYVAAGNDNLTPMARHEDIWSDSVEWSARVLEYVRHLTSLGLPVAGDTNPRFVVSVSL